MTQLSIRFHPDRKDMIFPDLEEGQGLYAEIAEVVVVANGMDGEDGVTRPSVAFLIALPDGKYGVALTSARLFCMMADTIRAKHPQAFEAP